MSTYTYVPQYTVAWRWPLFVTVAMVLIGFIPVFGLVNLLLMFPVSFFLGFNFFTHKEKMGRVYLGFLLLGVSIITPIVLLGATAFIH